MTWMNVSPHRPKLNLECRRQLFSSVLNGSRWCYSATETTSSFFKGISPCVFKCVHQLLCWHSHPPSCTQNNNHQHFSHGPPEPCSCEVRATWDTSPHVAPLTVPALVALIRRGVPGRSLWRHRLTALLALLQPGPAPHTSIPSNPSPLELPKGPGAWREVGHWRWSRVSQSIIDELRSVHLCSTLNSTTKPLFTYTTFFHTGCFETVCVVCFLFFLSCSLASSFSFLLLLLVWSLSSSCISLVHLCHVLLLFLSCSSPLPLVLLLLLSLFCCWSSLLLLLFFFLYFFFFCCSTSLLLLLLLSFFFFFFFFI